MARMFNANVTQEANPVTDVKVAAKVIKAVKTYIADTKEDVSFANALHQAKRDELFEARKAYLAKIR